MRAQLLPQSAARSDSPAELTAQSSSSVRRMLSGISRSMSRLFFSPSVQQAGTQLLNVMVEPPEPDAVGVRKAKMLCNDPVLCVALSCSRRAASAQEGTGVSSYNKLHKQRHAAVPE